MHCQFIVSFWKKKSKCLIFANFPALNHSVIMLVTQSKEKNYKGEICIIPGIFLLWHWCVPAAAYKLLVWGFVYSSGTMDLYNILMWAMTWIIGMWDNFKACKCVREDFVLHELTTIKLRFQKAAI